MEPLSPEAGGVGILMPVDNVDGSTDELREERMNVPPKPREHPTRDTATVAHPDDNSTTLHGRSDGTHGRVDPFPRPEP